jgi:hypothetical protein
MWRDAYRTALLAAAVGSALLARPAAALVLTVSGDTFVNGAPANVGTNFGAFSFVEVGLEGPPKNPIDRGLLEFDTHTLPQDASVAQATLRVLVTGTAFDPLGLPVTAASLVTAFDELTVTWLTQPAVAPGATSTAVMNALPDETFEIDVGDLVRAQRAAHPAFVALRLAPSDETETAEQWFQFSSKESMHGGAQLVLTFNTAAPAISPGAAIAALVLLAAVGAAAIRRVGARAR